MDSFRGLLQHIDFYLHLIYFLQLIDFLLRPLPYLCLALHLLPERPQVYRKPLQNFSPPVRLFVKLVQLFNFRNREPLNRGQLLQDLLLVLLKWIVVNLLYLRVAEFKLVLKVV